MKRLVLPGAVVAALACVCVLVSAQSTLRRGASPVPIIPPLLADPANALVVPSPGGDVPLSALVPARKSGFGDPGLSWAGQRRSPSALFEILTNDYQTIPSNHLVAPAPASAVPPGLYKTEPYTCIVVVPGGHPDDRCITYPGGGHSSMPIIRPELRFVPLAPARK